MRNIKLTLAYDGTEFHGWQTQPNGRTVQETLEAAVRAVTGDERIFCNASGRTDSGVHALGQVVNFHTATALGPDVLLRAINAHLPDDVVVKEAAEISVDFDANRDAIRKAYRYVVHDGPIPDLFLRRYTHHVKWKLDHDAMRQAARFLLGAHDFRSFETDWPNRASSVRTIMHVGVSRLGDFIWFDVEADGFLYNMVRAIAGTLIQIGRGHWPAGKLAEILAAEDRTQAGPTAPPQGLFLMRVTYAD